MPADRVITVNVTGEETRNEHGEAVPGAVVPVRTWASIRDRDLRDIEEEGGSRAEARRDWVIRFDARIYEHDPVLLAVMDSGRAWNVLAVAELTRQRRGEADLRRRFLTIQGVYTT